MSVYGTSSSPDARFQPVLVDVLQADGGIVVWGDDQQPVADGHADVAGGIDAAFAAGDEQQIAGPELVGFDHRADSGLLGCGAGKIDAGGFIRLAGEAGAV